MRTALLIFVLVVLCGSAMGAISPEPEFSILWGSFRSVTVVDSFLVGSTDDGLVIAQFNSATGLYDQVNHLFLNSAPTKVKRYDKTLAISTISDVIYFVDIHALPQVVLLGSADIQRTFADYAVDGQNLYVAMGFDGVWRFVMDGYTGARFVDSSLLPIHAIQVDTRNDTLYVLDDYNGVLEFSLAGEGFAQFAGAIWVPFQASSFAPADSLMVIALSGSKRVLLVHEDQTADTISTLVVPEHIVAIDSLIVVFDPASHMTDVINRGNRQVVHLPMDAPLLDGGQAFGLNIGSSPAVLYPDYRGSLLRLDLTSFLVDPKPTRVYGGPTQITDLEYFDGKLYVSQLDRPVDIFDIEPSGAPTYDTALFAPLVSASCLDQSMGRLLSLFPPIGSIFLTRYEYDSLFLDNYLDVDTSKVSNFSSNHYLVNNHYNLLTWGGSRGTLYTLSDTLYITPTATVTVQGVINDALVMRDWAAVCTNKGLLYLYRVTSDDALEYKASLGLPRSVASLSYDDRTGNLYAFAGERVITVDLNAAVLSAKSEATPTDIRAVAYGDDRLYSIGDEGIGVFPRPQPGDSSFPSLLNRGGRAGTMITAINDLVVVSGGHSLNIYDLRIPTDTGGTGGLPSQITLSPNYPNPFNPSTTIEYNLPSAGSAVVSVLNLLGQEVTRLVDEPQAAGHHVVVWDGRGNDTRSVATGIYFYRLLFNGQAQTRKMMLLK